MGFRCSLRFKGISILLFISIIMLFHAQDRSVNVVRQVPRQEVNSGFKERCFNESPAGEPYHDLFHSAELGQKPQIAIYPRACLLTLDGFWLITRARF